VLTGVNNFEETDHNDVTGIAQTKPITNDKLWVKVSNDVVTDLIYVQRGDKKSSEKSGSGTQVTRDKGFTQTNGYDVLSTIDEALTKPLKVIVNELPYKELNSVTLIPNCESDHRDIVRTGSIQPTSIQSIINVERSSATPIYQLMSRLAKTYIIFFTYIKNITYIYIY
jgi:hypothetical protein